MIDLLQAQGIAKMSQGAIKTLEDLVRVFLIRNRLKTEEISGLLYMSLSLPYTVMQKISRL